MSDKIDKIKSMADSEKFKAAVLKIKDNFKKFQELCTKLYRKAFVGFDAAGKKLHQAGISANSVTITGFVIGLLAINFLSMGMYGFALLCILINRAFDALDGSIAKYAGKTDFGVFLDAALDYMFYAGVIFGFALAHPAQNAVAAIFLLFGFTSAAATLLSYAVIAYKNNAPKLPEVSQSPFYLGGVAQGSETLVALIVLCLIPGLFMPIAIILGCLSFVKALSVIVTAYYNFVIAARQKAEPKKEAKEKTPDAQ